MNNEVNNDWWYEEPEEGSWEPRPQPAYVMTGRYRFILDDLEREDAEREQEDEKS